MRILIAFLLPAAGWAADFTGAANFRVQATPRSALISYVVPVASANITCTWEVSESNTYAPVVHDVDITLFPGSSSDNRAGSVSRGRFRTFVVGEGGTGIQYAPVASDGKRYSQALRAFAPHFGRVTCGSDTATLSFTTANVAPGDSYPLKEQPPDPSTPGIVGWPTIDWTDSSKCYIHPQTGICYQVLMKLNTISDFGASDVPFDHVYQATGWTNPNNVLANDGSLAVTNNTNPIAVTTDSANAGSGVTTGITLYVQGYVTDGSTGDDAKVQACLTIDGVNCYGPFIDATLPTQAVYSSGTTTTPLGDSDTSPVPYLQAWLGPGQAPPDARDLMPRIGNYTLSGTTLTFSFSGSSASFDQKWVSGSHIVLDNSGTPAETSVATVTDGFTITVASGSGPTGGAQFKAANFGFLIRKKTSNTSMSLDYVHVLRFQNRFPVLNGGSGSSRQTISRRYPEGWRITGATNASPIVLTTGTAHHDIQVGDTVHVRQVKGNTAANGDFAISAVTATTITLQSSAGNGTFSGDGILWKTGAKTGYLSQIQDDESDFVWFWINPDTTPADIRFLGLEQVSIAGVSGAFPMPSNSYVLDDSDPEILGSWIPSIPDADPGKIHMYKGAYKGDAATGLYRDIGAGRATSNFDWTDQTPGANNLTDQANAFDSECHGCMAVLGPKGIQNSNSLLLAGALGNQNTLGWFGVYDTLTNRIKALGNSWRAPGARFCGLHTAFTFYGTTGEYYLAWHGLEGSSYAGPYTVTVTNGGINNTAPQDCGTLLSGLGLSNVMGITGSQCSSFTVSSITPASEGNPVGDTRGPMIVGDFLDDFAHINEIGNTTETMRIVGIRGTTVVVQRALWADHPIFLHASGSKLVERCSTINNPILTNADRGAYYGSSVWWLYNQDPHMTNASDPYGQSQTGTVYAENVFYLVSHPSGRGSAFISDDTGQIPPPLPCPGFSQARGMGFRFGNHASTSFGCANGNPSFDGSVGNGLGEFVETHVANGPVVGPYADSWFSDIRPHQDSLTWQETVAKVSGGIYIYKVTNYCTDTGNTCDYKRQELTVWVGHKATRDVSAAGFDYASHDDSTYWYTFCRALKTDDCLTGSAADDVYVNAPFVANRPVGYLDGSGYGCLGNEGRFFVNDLNDICIALRPSESDQLVQNSMRQEGHDGFGWGQRRLGNEFTLPKNGGSAALVIQDPSPMSDGSGILLGDMFAITPPYPGPSAGIDRTTWISLPLKLGSAPNGTNNAYVRFGYNPSFYCSSRQESCVANAATVQPGSSVYSYETSDPYSGLSCASGCTVAIPALSQRVMWYQWVFRDAGNNVVASGPVEVLTTP